MSLPNGSSDCLENRDHPVADSFGTRADSPWKLIASGLAFPEAPRWHHDALWFSDIFDGRVKRIAATGDVTVVVDVPTGPSGLGWRPDGTLLVVSMSDRRLLAFDGISCHLEADLSGVARGPANDMVVAPSGVAYIGNFGYDYEAGAPRASAHLSVVDLDGAVHESGDDLWFPNGMAITPDGATLLVAETSASRVSSFTIARDGMLGTRQTWADLGARSARRHQPRRGGSTLDRLTGDTGDPSGRRRRSGARLVRGARRDGSSVCARRSRRPLPLRLQLADPRPGRIPSGPAGDHLVAFCCRPCTRPSVMQGRVGSPIHDLRMRWGPAVSTRGPGAGTAGRRSPTSSCECRPRADHRAPLR